MMLEGIQVEGSLAGPAHIPQAVPHTLPYYDEVETINLDNTHMSVHSSTGTMVVRVLTFTTSGRVADHRFRAIFLIMSRLFPTPTDTYGVRGRLE
jgi:hypothetical protein